MKITIDCDGRNLSEEMLKNMTVKEWQVLYVKWVIHLQELIKESEKNENAEQ